MKPRGHSRAGAAAQRATQQATHRAPRRETLPAPLWAALFLTLAFSSCFLFGNDENPPASVERSVSRTTGVAPLSVVFFAGAQRSSDTTHDFYRLEYSWDFGDEAAGTWGVSGRPKNKATGAVAAHVFETPGTYTVRLSVRNGASVVDSDSFTITVADPDAVYAGTKTICVSTDTDFSGAPPGAQHVTTTDLNQVAALVSSGTRILLRRGRSWTTSGPDWPNVPGPVTIGAFGPGTGPDALGIYANAPTITVTGSSFLDLNYKQDWRIMDLRLKDTTKTHGSFGGASEMRGITMLRLDILGFETGCGWSHWNEKELNPIDQMTIASCSIHDCGEYVLYVGAERLALLGNRFKNADESHVVRVWQGYKSVISDNEFSGASKLSSSNGRHALKLHGPGQNASDGLGAPTPGTAYLAKRTEFCVISNNVFGSSGPWPVAIGPQDAGQDERLSDIAFERNRLVSGYGEGANKVSVALNIWARHVSVRNNIFDGRASGNDYTGLRIENRGVEPLPAWVEVYNNTIYNPDANAESLGIFVKPGSSDISVKNNLVSFPQAQTAVLADMQGVTRLSNDKNLISPAPGFKAADASDPLLRNFGLVPGSAAIGAGGAVPVYDDYTGAPRPVATIDIGAMEQ